MGLVPPEEGCGRARGLALKALDLDHSLAEAHTSFAWTSLHCGHDFATAEKEFERAIELNSRYATVHHWFGMCLATMGRYEEGYTELKRAIRLDPQGSYIHFGLAFVHWCGRRYDLAIESCKKALELESQLRPGARVAGTFFGSQADVGASHRRTTSRAVDLSQRTPVATACLGEAYRAAGAPEEAHKLLLELTERGHVTAYFVSRIYVALGKTNETFQWLETAYQEHGEWMILLKVDPRFDSLHDAPRFQDLMRRMNFSRKDGDGDPEPR